MFRIEFHFVIVVAELSQAKKYRTPPLSREYLSPSKVFPFKYAVSPNICPVPQKINALCLPSNAPCHPISSRKGREGCSGGCMFVLRQLCR